MSISLSHSNSHSVSHSISHSLRRSLSQLARRAMPIAALVALVVAMDGTWATAQPSNATILRGPATGGSARAGASGAGASATTSPRTAEPDGDAPARGGKRALTGKLNLNTATEEQLLMLPSVGPSKAERIVAWRKKNGGFKRVADLRRVKGFGYKTFKKLEPYLAIQGETTLAPRQ